MPHLPEQAPARPRLEGTDELVRLLIQNVQDYAIFMLSPDGRVVTWNEGAERISGYAEREVLGQPLAVFHPESARERGDPERELRVAQSAGRCEVEAWRVRKDGSLMWATVVITALHGSGGELVGFGTIIRDLSDRKRIARQYEESRQRYRSLFEYNPDAVFAFDFRGELHSVNPAASLLCGYEVGELLQTSFLSLIVPSERGAAVECFRRAAAGEPQWLESALRHREGHRVEMSVAVVPILVHGEILGVYALAEDVTERKRGEEERERLLVREREARAEAEAANLAKSDFLSVMSHELRTPLNAIMGYTDLVYEGDAGPLNETQQKHLGRVRTSAARLLTLIEEILQFVRTDPQEDEAVNMEPVELTSLVRDTAGSAAVAAQERGLRLTLELPPGPVTLCTGAGKVRRILLNLLGNAVKFTPQGEIRVFLQQGADAVRIGVADTGIGIRPEHHRRIWEPFWQVEGGNTRSAEGAGLGLSLTRRLAQQLGGDVSLQSALGEGSTFVLHLPPEPRREAV